MFSKMLIFVFSMIGAFALLFGFIPGDFFEATMTSSIGVNPEIAEYYAMANVTMYANTGNDNMTHTYSSMDDSPTAPDWEAGLPQGQYMEVWWGNTYIEGLGLIPVLQFRHTEEVWWGRSYHVMNVYEEDGVTSAGYNNWIWREHIDDTWDSDVNASLFSMRCNHVSSNIFIGFNASTYTDIQDAWDGGELNYVLSYEYDWNQTNINAWTILGQLLTFQSPSLGIPGIAGSIFNTLIAIPFWVMVAILIIKLVQSMIPLIRGTDD